MSRLGTLDDFINEGTKEFAWNVLTGLASNPFDVDAEIAEIDGDWITFRYEDSYDREQGINKLAKLGIKKKAMSKDTQPSSFKFRYELSINKNSL